MQCETCHRALSITPEGSSRGHVCYPFVAIMSQGPINPGQTSLVRVVMYCRECFKEDGPTHLYNHLFPHADSWISKK